MQRLKNMISSELDRISLEIDLLIEDLNHVDEKIIDPVEQELAREYIENELEFLYHRAYELDEKLVEFIEF